jgi:hypothetical protein
MFIAIPTAPGLAVNALVMTSLYDQDVTRNEIVIIERGRPISEIRAIQELYPRRKALLDNICDSRNACLVAIKNWFQRHPSEACASINDSDCMHIFHDNLVKAEAFLINNPAYAVMALSYVDQQELEPAHVRSGIWIIHRRYFDAPGPVYFSHTATDTDSGRCECETTCAAIRAAGMGIRYLDGTKRLEHLKGR